MGCCFGKADAEDAHPAFDPVIGLCEKARGPNVRVESGAVSGSGSILGDSAVLQDKCYFEATILAEGPWAIGFATRDTELDGMLSQDKVSSAWTLTSSLAGLPPIGLGDVVGVALDQGDYPVQVYFYLKGRVIHTMSGIRGEVCPAFSVGDGARLQCVPRTRPRPTPARLPALSGPRPAPPRPRPAPCAGRPNFGSTDYAQGMPAGFQGIIKSMSLL